MRGLGNERGQPLKGLPLQGVNKTLLWPCQLQASRRALGQMGAVSPPLPPQGDLRSLLPTHSAPGH